MDQGTYSIGAIARGSGLSVSALRFYDSAGVLRPARVDRVTGYRWYTADQVAQARLIATLRRVSMPIPEVCAVLAARHDPVAARQLLDQHLRRLEVGLQNAHRHLDTARDLLARQEIAMTVMTVRGDDLAAVRFAVSTDPELPALNGILFDYDGAVLRLVASDRYRLAVATVLTAKQDGPAVQVIAPQPLVDECSTMTGEISIRLSPTAVHIGAVQAPAVEAVFPDDQRLLQTTPATRVRVTTADLIRRLTAGPTRTLTQAPDNAPHEVSVVVFNEDGVEVLDCDHPDASGFNREFLLEALGAGGAEQRVLALDGPVAPLVISDPRRPDDVSLLMPTRLS